MLIAGSTYATAVSYKLRFDLTFLVIQNFIFLRNVLCKQVNFCGIFDSDSEISVYKKKHKKYMRDSLQCLLN